MLLQMYQVIRILKLRGASDYDIVSNIGGLAGCVMEYSTECCLVNYGGRDYEHPILRGGFYSVWTTSDYPCTPALRAIKPNSLGGRDSNMGYAGFRVILFVK